jgi:ATP/maltotriose-dependent transcriptional regulator MalT
MKYPKTCDSILNIVVNRDVLNQKLNLLNDWQRLIVCLYLLGWSLEEIGHHAQLTKAGVSWHFRKAKIKMGVEINGQGN